MIREYKSSDKEKIDFIGQQISDSFVNKYDVVNNINKEYFNIYIYEENEVKGFIIIEDHIDFIDIIAIAVDISSQNQGIGYQLINYVVNKYQKRILLEVKATNINAIKLYEKSGFKNINIRKKYYDGIDAIIMERSI